MIDFQYAARVRHQELLRDAERARRVRLVMPAARRRPRRISR